MFTCVGDTSTIILDSTQQACTDWDVCTMFLFYLAVVSSIWGQIKQCCIYQQIFIIVIRTHLFAVQFQTVEGAKYVSSLIDQSCSQSRASLVAPWIDSNMKCNNLYITLEWYAVKQSECVKTIFAFYFRKQSDYCYPGSLVSLVMGSANKRVIHYLENNTFFMKNFTLVFVKIDDVVV